MKRNQAFPGNYLAKEDVERPTTAIIADVQRRPVQCESGMEDKPILTFDGRTGAALKPLIMNLVNWQTLEDAYGDDSDLWHGKPVEIFVDPSVMFGHKRVGGIRLRIPTGPAPTGPGPRTGAQPAPAPAAPPQRTPAPAPAQQAPPTPPPAPRRTLAENHQLVLSSYRSAKTVQRLDDLDRRAKALPFTVEQQAEQQEVYWQQLAELAPDMDRQTA